jgi:hypothetical protein
MSYDIQGHPDINSGFIDKFSAYKVERNTKTVIKSILTTFFSKYSTLYKMVAPELIEIENDDQFTNLFIEKEFPYYERKLPFIAIMSRTKREKKAFMGGDDYVYSQIVHSSTGEVIVNNQMYGNMYEVPITLSIAATSPETRMQIAELVSLCFTHYYRWLYMYKDIDGSAFNVVPNTGIIEISSEKEVVDNNTVTIIYTCSVGMISSIEYVFVDIGDNFNPVDIIGFDFGLSVPTSTGEYVVTSTGGYITTSTGQYRITSTGEYALTSTGEFVLTSTGEYVILPSGEFIIESGPIYNPIIW